MANATPKGLQLACIFFSFLLCTFVDSSFAIRPGNTIFQGFTKSEVTPSGVYGSLAQRSIIPPSGPTQRTSDNAPPPSHRSQPPPGQFKEGSVLPPSGPYSGENTILIHDMKKNRASRFSTPQEIYNSLVKGFLPPSAPSKRHNSVPNAAQQSAVIQRGMLFSPPVSSRIHH